MTNLRFKQQKLFIISFVLRCIRPNAELSDNCEKLFDQLEQFNERQKSKSTQQYIWPLQIMLLVLCPIVLEELVYSIEKGGPCSLEHLKKKQFLVSIVSIRLANKSLIL
jgi:hypothetical protein